MKKYALIGKTLSHSFSKIIHEKLYKRFNLVCNFELINVEEDQLNSLIQKLKDEDYFGYNVTIPYKTEMLKYVDLLSPTVNEVNCCNTIHIVNDKICAFNTDFYGFDFLLNYNKLKFDEAFILGSGATSRTVSSVLDSKMIKYTIISRSHPVYNYDYLRRNVKGKAIINTTPVGMYPNIEESIITKDVAKEASLIIDLIYNPNITKLMSYNRKSYNGLSMLVYQASKSFEYWTGIKVDIKIVNEIIKEIEVM